MIFRNSSTSISIDLIKAESHDKSPTKTDREQISKSCDNKTTTCLIGGKSATATVGPYSLNIVSRGHFRALRLEKFYFFCSDRLEDLTIGDIKFIGSFATKIECNNRKLSYATFYVREGDESVIILNRKTAKYLNIIQE